jgi:hypothetical protein
LYLDIIQVLSFTSLVRNRALMFYSMIPWSCLPKYEPTSSPCYEKMPPRQV